MLISIHSIVRRYGSRARVAFRTYYHWVACYAIALLTLGLVGFVASAAHAEPNWAALKPRAACLPEADRMQPNVNLETGEALLSTPECHCPPTSHCPDTTTAWTQNNDGNSNRRLWMPPDLASICCQQPVKTDCDVYAPQQFIDETGGLRSVSIEYAIDKGFCQRANYGRNGFTVSRKYSSPIRDFYYSCRFYRSSSPDSASATNKANSYNRCFSTCSNIDKRVCADACRAAAKIPDTKYVAEAGNPNKLEESVPTAFACAARRTTRVCYDRIIRKFNCVRENSSCLARGTLVLMEDGSSKTIETITAGERVRGHSGSSNGVLEVVDLHWDDLTLYDINDGALLLTADHPVMTNDGWKAVSYDAELDRFKYGLNQVGELQVGDVVVAVTGPIIIKSITPTATLTDYTTYNLRLDGDETFYANGIVVKDN